MFETYGDELAYVQGIDPARVWSIVEADGCMAVEPGFHVVNLLGYLVTEIPATGPDCWAIIDQQEYHVLPARWEKALVEGDFEGLDAAEVDEVERWQAGHADLSCRGVIGEYSGDFEYAFEVLP